MPERGGRGGDVVLVFAAITIAYCIWLVAKMSNVEVEVLSGVPISVIAPPFIEAEPGRSSVNLEVRFPKNRRKEVHSGAFRVVVSDPELVKQAGIDKPQPVTVTLMPEDVQRPGSMPQSVRVEQVEPNGITVYVRYRTAPALIVPTQVGEPARGFEIERASVNDEERLLTGPPEVLRNLERNQNAVVELPTAPIDVTSRRDSFSTSVAIRVPPPAELLDPDSRMRQGAGSAFAIVQVIIREEETTRTLRGIPITVPTLTRNLIAQTQPATGTVTIAGPRSKVQAFKPNMVQLRPKNPPEETLDFKGQIAIEARKDEEAPAEVRIVGIQPDVVLLGYDTKTSPTLEPAPERE